MGLLSGFIGGAAQAGGEILQRDRESATRRDEAQFASDLAERRERALAELRNQYQIDSEGRQVARTREEEAYQASPDRINQVVGAEKIKGAGLIANRIALAPEAGKAAQVEFEAGAPAREAAQKEKLTFALDEYRQKTAAELQAEITKLNDPKYLQGKAKEAAAGRDPNSAALANVQLQAAKLALKEKEAEAKMPPAVKGSIAAIQKQVDAISAAVTKAELEGSAQPDALKKYQDRIAELNGNIRELYRPYMGDKAPKALDATPNLEQQALSDAAKAIATGRITEAEANKRLQAAGFKTLNVAAPKGGGIIDTAKPAQAPPVDKLGDQPIGKFTPMSMIEESAKAGNRRAAEYLRQRADGSAYNQSAPRTAAEMLNQ